MKKVSGFICLCVSICVIGSLAACGKITDLDEAERLKNSLGQHTWEYTASEDKPLTGYVSLGETFQYYDGSIYFMNGNSSPFLHDNTKEVTTMKRLNVKTGNITNVCSDPLCSHTTASCPFAGRIGSFFIDGSNIVYMRNYVKRQGEKSVGIRQFCSYNLDNMKFTAHITEEVMSGVTTSQYNKMLYHNNTCYYYDYIYDDATSAYYWLLKKLDMETNKITIIGDEKFYDDGESNPFEKTFLFIIKDRIYFKDINTIYSTTLDLTDKQVVAEGIFTSDTMYTDGKYIFYGIAGNDERTEDVYRINIDGSNKVDLGIHTSKDWFLTTEYIYYYHPDYFELQAANAAGSVSFFSDALRRCDYDGKMKEDVFVADHANKTTPELYLQLHGTIVVGDYIYSSYYAVSDTNRNGLVDDGEYYQNSNDFYDFNIMRIHINTGERSCLYINRK